MCLVPCKYPPPLQDVARVYITFAMEGVKNSSHDGLCVGKESACEWPTPILHAVVPTEPETQATLVNWFKYLERSEECMTKSNKGGFQSATNLFERIAHSDLKDLQSLVSQFCSLVTTIDIQ